MKQLCSIVLLFYAGSTSASDSRLSLNDIPRTIRDENLDLRAARLLIEQARGRHLAAGRLPNPTLSFDYQNQSHLSPQTGVFAVDQTFPLTRRLSLEKKLTLQLVEAAELEVQNAERQLVAEALGLAVRLLTLSKQRQLRLQQLHLAQKLADFAKGKAKSGEVSPLDAKQVQLDAQKIGIESRQIEAQSTGLEGQLKSLVGLRSDAPLDLLGSLDPPTLPAKSSSWDKRPDYQLAMAKADAAVTEQDLAKSQRLPDISAGVFSSQEMQDVTRNQRERTGFFGFRISVPLPVWNNNQGAIHEKAASAERARLEAEALGYRIHNEAATARREMEAAAIIVNETRSSLLPLATQHEEELEKAYQTGQADLLAVLRARDQRLQLESSALDALRDFHLARIRYESTTGGALP